MVNNMPPVECPLRHLFCKGMYMRFYIENSTEKILYAPQQFKNQVEQ
jgi:hypothetical protein